jgi:signal transduction histidine kinase/ActR/RegA family two-component response regulator
MASVVPAVGVLLANEWGHHARSRDAVREEAGRLAAVVSADLARQARTVEHALRTVAPEVTHAGRADCARILDAVHASLDDASALWLEDRTGHVACASTATPASALERELPSDGDVGERPRVQRAALDDAAALPLSVGIDGGAQHLVALLDARRLAARYAAWPWPPHSSLTLADHAGAVLVRLPERPGSAAPLPQAWSALLRADRPGTVEVDAAVEGEDHVVGYVPPAAGPQALLVAVGMGNDALGPLPATDGSGNALALLVLAVLLAMAVSWFVSERLVHRPLDVLTRTARQLRRGDLGTRARLAPSDASEFGGLGSTFNELAETLQAREAERAATDEELRRARDAAEAASRSKTHFMAAVSHDLRQPLHSMSLTSDLLRLKLRGRPEAELADRLGRSVANLADLVSAVLDVSQLDAGLIVPQRDAFALDRVLQGAADEFTDEAEHKHIDLRIDPVPWWVRSDLRLLRRIVHNLVANALKYTGEGGTVQVRCVPDGDALELAVIDTGIGIPMERQQEIWEEFRQLDNPARDPSKGLGLGLSIVRRMAVLLDHPIRLVSEPGTGTVVSLRLPLADARPDTDRMPEAPRLAGRLLLVEDEPSVAAATAGTLREWGLEVDVARTAEAAIAAIGEASLPWDALISDFRLPGRSGLDVIATARRRWPWLRAFVMTGDVGANLAQALPGDVRLLAKPLSATTLAGALAPLAEAAAPAADSDRVLQRSGEVPPTIVRPRSH